MSTSIVLTVIGTDKPGFVQTLSSVLAAHGASWSKSRMASLAGKFAGILLADVPDDETDKVIVALQELGPSGLKVTVERSAMDLSASTYRRVSLDVVGRDRPNIMHEIVRALAERGINIVELTTERLRSSTAGTLFHAVVQVGSPANMPLDELRKDLDALANELMVDILLEESKPRSVSALA
ncbi:MAG: glycine cleavage system protein R [Gammaproteobacteria bacterium]